MSSAFEKYISNKSAKVIGSSNGHSDSSVAFINNDQIYDKLKKWIEKHDSYSDGNKHRFLVKFAGACNRFGMPREVTISKLQYDYLHSAGFVDPEDFSKIVNEVYTSYSNQFNISFFDSTGKKCEPYNSETYNYNVGNISEKKRENSERKKDELEKKILNILQKEEVNVSAEILPAETAFGVYDQINPLKKYIIGTLGNFTAISGKAKSRKSFLVALLIGLILKPSDFFLYSSIIDPKIVIFDTEQGAWHCQKAFKRILKLSGLKEEEFCKRIKYIKLRNYDTKTREQVINYVIRTEKPNIVVIDGIRDLAFDINSPQEATELSTKLLNWSGKYNCHIINILHQNKNDRNLRGHLGSEILNKCEAVISVIKDAKDKDISIVEADEMREQEFPAFAFSVNDQGLPEVIEGYSNNKETPSKQQPEEINLETHKTILKDIFRTQKDLSQTALIPFLRIKFSEHGFHMGVLRLRDYVSYYELQGLLRNDSKTKNGVGKKLNYYEP